MIKQISVASAILLASLSPAFASWPASEADSFPTALDREIAARPEMQVPEATSIKQACEIYSARLSVEIATDSLYQPMVYRELDRSIAGEISDAEFMSITAPWQRRMSQASVRSHAAAVGVLRATGYEDWKMYSRYSIHGSGDLWRSNVISGDEVARDKDHPDFKYTYAAFWRRDVSSICKGYN